MFRVSESQFCQTCQDLVSFFLVACGETRDLQCVRCVFVSSTLKRRHSKTGTLGQSGTDAKALSGTFPFRATSARSCDYRPHSRDVPGPGAYNARPWKRSPTIQSVFKPHAQGRFIEIKTSQNNNSEFLGDTASKNKY